MARGTVSGNRGASQGEKGAFCGRYRVGRGKPRGGVVEVRRGVIVAGRGVVGNCKGAGSGWWAGWTGWRGRVRARNGDEAPVLGGSAGQAGIGGRRRGGGFFASAQRAGGTRGEARLAGKPNRWKDGRLSPGTGSAGGRATNVPADGRKPGREAGPAEFRGGGYAKTTFAFTRIPLRAWMRATTVKGGETDGVGGRSRGADVSRSGKHRAKRVLTTLCGLYEHCLLYTSPSPRDRS